MKALKKHVPHVVFSCWRSGLLCLKLFIISQFNKSFNATVTSIFYNWITTIYFPDFKPKLNHTLTAIKHSGNEWVIQKKFNKTENLNSYFKSQVIIRLPVIDTLSKKTEKKDVKNCWFMSQSQLNKPIKTNKLK